METNYCSLCGFKIYPGHGTICIKNNLNVYRFCRSKCFKLFKLKKNPFFLRWTSKNRTIRGNKLIMKNEMSIKNFSLLYPKNIYNNYLILQTLYQLRRIEKIEYNKSIDFKLIKNKNLNK